jgi:hypothetical protein
MDNRNSLSDCVSHHAAITLNSLIGLAQARVCKIPAYELSSSWTSIIKSLSGQAYMVVQDDHKSGISQSFHSLVKNLSRC